MIWYMFDNGFAALNVYDMKEDTSHRMVLLYGILESKVYTLLENDVKFLRKIFGVVLFDYLTDLDVNDGSNMHSLIHSIHVHEITLYLVWCSIVEESSRFTMLVFIICVV